MPKNLWKVALPVGFGLAIPVLALTGCPFPNPTTSGSPSASPSASAAPTPAPRTGLLIKAVTLDELGAASRSVTVTNQTGGDIADLGNYIVSYEYSDAGTNKMQHLRFGKGATLKSGADFKFYDKACGTGETACVTKEDGLGGTGAATMGLQASQGSLVIYKGSASKDNQHDYVQYGTAPGTAFVHVADAVSKGNWDDASKYGPAIAATAGKGISAKSVGGTGSTNWQAN